MKLRVRLMLGTALSMLVLLATQAPAAEAATDLVFQNGVTRGGTSLCLNVDANAHISQEPCQAGGGPHNNQQHFLASGYDSGVYWWRLESEEFPHKCLDASNLGLRIMPCAPANSANKRFQSWHFSGMTAGGDYYQLLNEDRKLAHSATPCLYGSSGGGVRLDACTQYGKPGWLNHA